MSESRTEGSVPDRERPGIAESTLRRAGWAVLVSLLGLGLSWTFGILFLTNGGVYAPLSDISSLIYRLPLVLVAWVLYLVYRSGSPGASGAVLAVGLLGVTVSVVSGLGLAVTDLGVPTGMAGASLAGQRIGGLVTGLWLLGVSGQELRHAVFPRRVAVAGIVAGSGMVLLQSSLLIGGVSHPGFGIGSIVQLLGTVCWSVWIGRRLLAGRVRADTDPRRAVLPTR